MLDISRSSSTWSRRRAEPERIDGAVIVTSPGKPELLSYFQPDRSLEALLRVSAARTATPTPWPRRATCPSRLHLPVRA